MNAFETHKQVIEEYRSYLRSFISVADDRIAEVVENAISGDELIPEPLVQFNPAYESGESLESAFRASQLHPEIKRILGVDYKLYKHQIEAIKQGVQNKGFVVTSGTGSGKSLTFLTTVFNDILKQGEDRPQGPKAILVYPMNALINSQDEEIRKLAINYLEQGLDEGACEKFAKLKSTDRLTELERITGKKFPLTWTRYTGQDSNKADLQAHEKDIILTNYMMLELIMTREGERELRAALQSNLKFLVFDELHTYRGRQGSDVAMLIRRIRQQCQPDITCIGTSATMASDGTPSQKKEVIATVAKDIFGSEYSTDQIIGEYLSPCTDIKAEIDDKITTAVGESIDTSWKEDVYRSHPLTIWLEREVAIIWNEDRWERRIPLSISAMADKLHEQTEVDRADAARSIRDILVWTENLNESKRAAGERERFLPFRFHQFISQTGIASVTLDDRENRDITIQPGLWKREGEKSIPLYPILISRHSGMDFICVRKDTENSILKPRNPDEPIQYLKAVEGNKKKNQIESNYADGYLVLVDEYGGEFEDLEDALPDTWWDSRKGTLKPHYASCLPQRISFSKNGKYRNDGSLEIKAYFIVAPLLIDPTAGIIYADSRTNERSKLMRLGNEGRSTATSILSYSLLHSLSSDSSIPLKDRKVMSFTDNRQDASLQTGHYNDLMATLRLRNGIWKAVHNNPDGLDLTDLITEVRKELGLREKEYASEPSASDENKDPNNTKALEQLLLVRLLQDLRRGWRYVLPNLEQCALLEIGYRGLENLTSSHDWSDIKWLQEKSEAERSEVLTQFLNFFRSSKATHHKLIEEDKLRTERFLYERLDSDKPWSLDKDEKIETPTLMSIADPGEVRYRYRASIGARSGLGKYVRRQMPAGSTEEEIEAAINKLCDILHSKFILKKEEDVKGKKGVVTCYLLRSDAIIWRVGNEQVPTTDAVRLFIYGDYVPKPNEFFKILYKRDFKAYGKPLIAREHTGQLSNKDRIEREEAFRAGSISTLFCSPTMELGIDIANLNVVHMRNVPPNPANYAQRGGRAGRSGQTALVFTYCAARSPHDRNFFKRKEEMVAGQVLPPTLELRNQEMITAHFNAVVLMEVALAELKEKAGDVLDIQLPCQPLFEGVRERIRSGIASSRSELITAFHQLNDMLGVEVDDHVKRRSNSLLDSFEERFDHAFDRWRTLYNEAIRQRNEARRIIDDHTIKRNSPQQKDAENRERIAKKQINLLLNDRKFGSEFSSEFYIFRYLAAEGFLPGYNFTRLPIRAYVGQSYAKGDGEYISRPRMVGIKEFGPNNLIYHNGSKYRMERMMVLNAEDQLEKLKISTETGYILKGEEYDSVNNDPITGTPLRGEHAEPITAIQLSESIGRPIERISCEEEDRMSEGYDIVDHFNYPNGIEGTEQLTLKHGGEEVIQLTYGPATSVYKLNRKWRKRTQQGFRMDQRNGRWLKEKDLKNEEVAANSKEVMIYTTDTCDTLYLQPLDALDIDEDSIISLAFALQRGLQKLFLLEEGEIGVGTVGKHEGSEAPNMLIYERAEGSLGVLKRLMHDPQKLKELFRTSYAAMHFDPESKEETEEGSELGKATYQDLLSYYNQIHHDVLDRRLTKEPLEKLMMCTTSPQRAGKDRDAHFEQLLKECDRNSATEKPFLVHLFKHGLTLPDRAQVNIEEFYISADFVYDRDTGPVLVFCDGSVHDEERVKIQDGHKRNLLEEAGYDVIVWHYSEPIEKLIERRKDIFRKVV